jgi:hypothetical protein
MTHRSAKLLTLALATSLAAACAPMPSDPNAFATVTSISGDVTLRRAGTDAWVPATAGTRLASQDRVWCRTGEVEVRYDIGETQQLRANTVVEVRLPAVADSRR